MIELYNITKVSEGAARHSSVATVSARDPEGATVTYSVASGDPEGHFSIGSVKTIIKIENAILNFLLRGVNWRDPSYVGPGQGGC